MYADYEYYKENFGGKLIPEENFNRSVIMAGRYIDLFTFDRITGENQDKIEGLKDCACDMAESIYKVLTVDSGKEKKSETTDGYSVSYVTEQSDGESIMDVLKRNLYAIATLYLSRTGLLYSGGD